MEGLIADRAAARKAKDCASGQLGILVEIEIRNVFASSLVCYLDVEVEIRDIFASSSVAPKRLSEHG